MKRGRGRPTKYNKWIARAICLRLMDGESLRSICDREEYPARRAVLYWLNSNEDFMRQYMQAREIQQELLYEELFEIADDGTNDFMEKEGSGQEVVNHENINRSRLRVDTRKWVMERMAPKKYSGKIQEEVKADTPIGNIKIEVVSANSND